jgi:hypothetical protein
MSMRNHIIALSLAPLGLVASSCGTSTGHDGSTSEPADTTDPTRTSVDDDTGGGPVCGNGIVELGEECDGIDLAGGTCQALGFDGGVLACSEQCSYDDGGCGGASVEGIGYFKASNTEAWAEFGSSVALSEDGSTLVVGAPKEDSNATGVGGNEADDSMGDSGAVYVFVRDGRGQWSQQAYVKASNPDVEDYFGWSVALSSDGNTLAVGAPQEDSNATGIDGDQLDDSASLAGAVYVFVRDGMGQWSQQEYVKASNAEADDQFGYSVASSRNGDMLAVGAPAIDGDQTDESASGSGAAYIFVRDGMGQWSQQEYVKASNAGAADQFGYSVASSIDGVTLAVGAPGEGSSATGTDGDQADDSASGSGAAYVFVQDGMDQWSQLAYVKASNTEEGDAFGSSIALSGDGDTLAVGAPGEDSPSIGINGDQGNDPSFVLMSTGAAYVFVRDGGGQWSQQAYVKASNTGGGDRFGWSLDLSNDGDLFAIGAKNEESNAVGIGGNEQNDTAALAGAVYAFARDGLDEWSQQAYMKASNTGSEDSFGCTLALSSDGDTLAVGAQKEDSNATGIGGDQVNDSAHYAGAVYVY